MCTRIGMCKTISVQKQSTVTVHFSSNRLLLFTFVAGRIRQTIITHGWGWWTSLIEPTLWTHASTLRHGYIGLLMYRVCKWVKLLQLDIYVRPEIVISTNQGLRVISSRWWKPMQTLHASSNWFYSYLFFTVQAFLQSSKKLWKI